MIVEPLHPDLSLPVVVRPDGAREAAPEELSAWLARERAWVDRTLGSAGAVLFRGFGLADVENLAAILSGFEPQLSHYIEGQSKRQAVAPGIYTSTEYPARLNITIHNELSYAKRPPRRIHFFCCIPADSGGETPILDCRAALRAIPDRIVQEFTSRGIRYVKVMHGAQGLGKSWQEHFETDNRERVSEYLRTSGVEWEWRNDGSLWTSQVRPAVVRHPVSQEEVWFNQAALWHYTDRGVVGAQILADVGEANLPTNAYFGDGAPIPEDDLSRIRADTWERAVVFRWQTSDLLMLDNHLVAHGRRAYEGARRLLVAMAQ